MERIKLRKIGNSIGVILPKEATSRLRVAEGDTLLLTETPDGIQLTPYDADFEAAMEAFEQTRRKYRNTLRKLAK
ncbi:MAG TPA: AbrB/MazE/SpoVT family DNA-binding domain-containing protein [Gammaproteobacteria bacterium]|nr:AbrB/MazE/SpoVT family DNA-binding domain-containing protein [Gammaproteobacteria bacterium]